VLKRVIVAAAIFAAAFSTHAHAQEIDDATRSAARQLATEGSAAYQADNFEAAYDNFNRAYQLVHAPTVGIWAARSLAKLNRLVEASERYLEIERAPLAEGAPPEHQKAKDDAAAERKELMARIPNVKVLIQSADPADVFVTLNGKVLQSALIGVNNPVDPGKLTIKGVRGEQVVEATIEIAERQARDVKLQFKAADAPAAAPAATEPPPPAAAPVAVDTGTKGGGSKTLAFVAMGVGGAGLIVGGAFGLMAMGDKSDLDSACTDDNRCPSSSEDAIDSYDTKRTISTIGFIGGAVLVGAGVVLYLTADSGDSRPQQARVGAFFDGRQAGVVGRFQ
jgi:hypothetical protein